jgi:rifampin ADP-ribosylating transferase
VTDKKFPGNPTRSYRTSEPVTIVGELLDWIDHSPENVAAMIEGLAALKASGESVIYD